MSFYVAIFYAPWFLKSSLMAEAPFNDLKAIVCAEEITKIDPIVGNREAYCGILGT